MGQDLTVEAETCSPSPRHLRAPTCTRFDPSQQWTGLNGDSAKIHVEFRLNKSHVDSICAFNYISVAVHTWERRLKQDLQNYKQGPVHWELRETHRGIFFQMLTHFTTCLTSCYLKHESFYWRITLLLTLTYHEEQNTRSHDYEPKTVYPFLSMTQQQINTSFFWV